jgi:hypothetical protein
VCVCVCVCVCGSMSIFVNASPTKEIDNKRRLKQGDPLAHFLFILIVEGYSGLVEKAVSQKLF